LEGSIQWILVEIQEYPKSNSEMISNFNQLLISCVQATTGNLSCQIHFPGERAVLLKQQRKIVQGENLAWLI